MPATHGAEQHLEPGDVGRRQVEDPLARAAEPGVGGAGGGAQRARGTSTTDLGRPGRAGGVEDERPGGRLRAASQARSSARISAAVPLTGRRPATSGARARRGARGCGPVRRPGCSAGSRRSTLCPARAVGARGTPWAPWWRLAGSLSWQPQRSGSKEPAPAPSPRPWRPSWPAPASRRTSTAWWRGRRRWRWSSRWRCRSGSTTPTTTPTASAGPTRTGSGRCGSSGSGVATPGAVKRAAFAAFGVAAVAGLVLAATTAWWLVALGAVCILAAWFYTGGSSPYGYRGLGEVMVFVFFGLVAVVGTTYVQTAGAGSGGGAAPARPWRSATGCRRRCSPRSGSAPSPARSWWPTTCATSPPTPRSASGRWPWCSATPGRGSGTSRSSPWPRSPRSGSRWWPRRGRCWRWSPPVPGARAVAVVRSGAVGRALVPVLQLTGVTELLYGLGLFLGLLLA